MALQTVLLLPVMCSSCRKERHWAETLWCLVLAGFSNCRNHCSLVASKVPSLLWDSMFCRGLFSSHFCCSFLSDDCAAWRYWFSPSACGWKQFSSSSSFPFLFHSTLWHVSRSLRRQWNRRLRTQSATEFVALYTYSASAFLQPRSHVQDVLSGR